MSPSSFALNLEYLEAEFYSCAANGRGIPGTTRLDIAYAAFPLLPYVGPFCYHLQRMQSMLGLLMRSWCAKLTCLMCYADELRGGGPASDGCTKANLSSNGQVSCRFHHAFSGFCVTDFHLWHSL